MRVLLPAPFSPSSAWISPGSTTRSMWSFATRDPKVLVMPRSSSFTWTAPSPWFRCSKHYRPPDPPRDTLAGGAGVSRGVAGDGMATARATLRPGRRPAVLLGRGGRLDLQLTADDLLRQLVDLVLELLRDVPVEVGVRGEREPVVLQRADVRVGAELLVDGLLDRVEHGRADLLHDRGQDDGAVVGGLVPVGVDADDLDVTGGLRDRRRAEADRAGDGHDDVRALVDERLADVLAVVLAVEVAREDAGLLRLVPAEQRDRLAVVLVVLGDAVGEAVHEDRD